jgi:hypothetical protein
MRFLMLAVLITHVAASVQAQDPDRDRDLTDKELIQGLQKEEGRLKLEIARLQFEKSTALAEKAIAERRLTEQWTGWPLLCLVIAVAAFFLGCLLQQRLDARKMRNSNNRG